MVGNFFLFLIYPWRRKKEHHYLRYHYHYHYQYQGNMVGKMEMLGVLVGDPCCIWYYVMEND